MTVKPCNRPGVGAHKLEFIDAVSLTRIMLGLLSPGSARADVGWDGKYFCQNYQNLLIRPPETVVPERPYVSFRVIRKKSGKLWSTFHSVLAANVYPSNRLFRKTIFRPLGGAAFEIFTRATEWPNLASPYSTNNKGSPTIFFQRGVKIGLKFSVWATRT